MYRSVRNYFIGISIFISYQLEAQDSSSSFSPTIKMKGLIHSRFESSLTDSVDVQNKFNPEPVRNNFRLRRLELRADIKLNEKWSGVIRLQFPQLKSLNTNNLSSAGNVIELAYGEYKANDKLHIRFGQFKMPYEMDELISHEDLRMIDRGTTSVLLVNNLQAGYQPGLMVFGTFLKEKTPLTYYLAVVNGSSRTDNYDNNSQKNIVERVEFFPIKSFRIGLNTQQIFLNDSVHTFSYGADLQLLKYVSEKITFIMEGEYILGSNISSYYSSLADTALTAFPAINEFNLSGYFGQALVRINVNKNWCRTFEIGAKYESSDPLTTVQENSFYSIIGNIGFIFLPENMARLQFNFIHTNWDGGIPGNESINSANMFVAQLQLKI